MSLSLAAVVGLLLTSAVLLRKRYLIWMKRKLVTYGGGGTKCGFEMTDQTNNVVVLNGAFRSSVLAAVHNNNDTDNAKFSDTKVDNVDCAATSSSSVVETR